MNISDMIFPEVKLITNFKATDERGEFVKIYNDTEFIQMGLRTDFKELYYSQSQRNVIRGMHFQTPPYAHAKLVHVIKGEVTDVVVDMRKESGNYGKAMDVKLSEEKAQALYIPEGFAHGFVSRTDDTIVLYCVTSGYSKEHDKGIRWDSIGYDWKAENPVLSQRDKNFPMLYEYDSPFEV